MRREIIVIDDDELFRAGLTCLINSFDFFTVFLSITPKEFNRCEKELNEQGSCDLVLLCPPLPASKGIRFCERVVRLFPDTPVMLFTNLYSKLSVIKAIQLGVSAYYTKQISPHELESIMIELTANSSFSDIKLEQHVRNVLVNDEQLEINFTESEEEVLRLVCEQKSSTEISNYLGISVRTVESRKRNMMLKTKSKNMIGVVLLFLKSNQFQYEFEN